MLLTTLLHFCYCHRFTQALPSATRLLWILALNNSAALAGSGLWMGLIKLGFHEVPSDTPFAHFTSARLYSLVTWNLAYFGLELVLEHRAARLELSEAREVARAAELKQLQMQLNPHFLFNALNAVMGAQASLSISSDPDSHLTIEVDGKTPRVKTAEILWIKAQQNYSVLRIMGERAPLMVQKSMADWESILPPEIFERLDRSVILNISQIQTVSWLSRDETLVAFSGESEALRLGRTAAQRLKGRLATGV